MKRRSGILLHITSLPSPYGIGDLGPEAYRFADFLAEAKQSIWQVLPLNPTDTAYHNSPYHTLSAFAYNPLLISPELMIQDGLLNKQEVNFTSNFPEGAVEYKQVTEDKRKLFQLAYERFKKHSPNYEYEKFCSENSGWLEDYALFVSLKAHFNGLIWNQWPSEIRDRDAQALKSLRGELQAKIDLEKFIQYLFIQQWLKLKRYCSQKGIDILGDMPIYVQYDSVDVWVNPEIFKLDNEKRPYVVAGVPPDYFSATGQLWGNPLYRWEVLKERRYDWWMERIKHILSSVDFLRIDHFRGFVGYWEVPSAENNAFNGRWVEAPVLDFFNQLTARFSNLPIIAEDLGTITPDVKEIMHRFQFPGMKVLLFAFDQDDPMHPYLPHNYEKNCVVYTGTHDNNTVRGWFENEATPEDKQRLSQYLGREVTLEDVNWELIRLAMASVADLVIFPLQDILGLGQEARMNQPATIKGNWQWRLLPEQLTPSHSRKLLIMTEVYGRA